MVRRVGLAIVIACVFSVLGCDFAWAQATAQISGTVRDPSAAVLPGVELTATQTETGLVRKTISNETGSYVLPNLALGPYRLEAALPGFRTFVQQGIVLQVNSNPVINPVLQVGQVSEQIEVQADAAVVETRNAGVGQVIEKARILELPLNGRNVTDLITLSGAAVQTSSSDGGNHNMKGGPSISVAGGLVSGVQYSLDGAVHLDMFNGTTMPLPFPDALQEFRFVTSTQDASNGMHSGAAVNAVTKSGTNAFHGDLFEFLRNGDFNARDFFATSRDTLKRNQFGGTAGGPVIRDKLFFFGGYQRTSQRSDPSSVIAFVPTAAMLTGDFTAFASEACQNKPVNLAASQGFVGNKVSPSLLNPVALNIQKTMPVTGDPCGKVVFGKVANQDEDLWAARIDYQQSPKNSIFGRLTLANLNVGSTFDGKNPLSIDTYGVHDLDYSLALGNTYLIGPNIVSSLRVSMNR